MTPVIRFSALGAATLLAACAGKPARVDVPAAIATTPQQTLAMSVAATGVQIYECRSSGDAQRPPQWTFVAPEAALFDADGRQVGQHGAGPNWTFDDGTRITARVAARVDAPQAGAIPWLLLESRTAPGNGAPSRFGDVRSIQRINTRGGSAPSEGCKTQDVGSRVRVPYTADYLFYSGTAR
jgi:hypothetical protein